MLEFKISYFDDNFHKKGDPPFQFPPSGDSIKTNSNLIEIIGGNGTGKTTLLNILALATGYLSSEKDIEKKPLLKQKLEDLDSNESLVYDFTVSRNTPSPMELTFKKEGNKKQIVLNNKPISIDFLNQLDVVFLTEDDPKKVVTASLGKLETVLTHIDRSFIPIYNKLADELTLIQEYRNLKEQEQKLETEIKENRNKLTKLNCDATELKELISKSRRRDTLKEKVEILRDEKEILDEYAYCKKEYEKIQDLSKKDIIRQVSKNTQRRDYLNDTELKEKNKGIIQICESLKIHGRSLDSQKLLHGDWAELNQISISENIDVDASKIKLVDDMYDLLRRYDRATIVPVVEKPIADVMNLLYDYKLQFASNRASNLIKALKNVMHDKKEIEVEIERLNKKIESDARKIEQCKFMQAIDEKYSKAADRYFTLKKILDEGKSAIYQQWGEVSAIDGNTSELINKQQNIDGEIRGLININERLEKQLSNIKAANHAVPKYTQEEISKLITLITRMRECFNQWTNILRNPTKGGAKYKSSKDGFSYLQYSRFIQALSSYLGKKFEPMVFANMFHKIKAYDIENETFITEEDRRIRVSDLSQGQNKLIALEGSFRDLSNDRNKIVLIDEIADLDETNLQKVKKLLREKFDENALLFAVLVRPARETLSQSIVIKEF